MGENKTQQGNHPHPLPLHPSPSLLSLPPLLPSSLLHLVLFLFIINNKSKYKN